MESHVKRIKMKKKKILSVPGGFCNQIFFLIEIDLQCCIRFVCTAK